MPHRDELEAAQNRIKQLEDRVEELEEKDKPKAPKPPRKGKPPSKLGCLGGLSGLVLFIVAMTVFGGQACVACNSDVTDPALAALQKCPAARDLLGDNIEYSVLGCTNYRSRSGGDPFNEGCHSSSSFQVPVRGTKGRASYRFSTSETGGRKTGFTGGTVIAPGVSISVPAHGDCTRSVY